MLATFTAILLQSRIGKEMYEQQCSLMLDTVVNHCIVASCSTSDHAPLFKLPRDLKLRDKMGKHLRMISTHFMDSNKALHSI